MVGFFVIRIDCFSFVLTCVVCARHCLPRAVGLFC